MNGICLPALFWIGDRSSFDPMQYFSWWIFLGAGLLFTVNIFTGILWKNGSLVFSKRNAKPISSVLTIHAEFLLVLFVLMWGAPFLYPALPGWMTDTFYARGTTVSTVDVVFIVLMGIMHLIERRLIYQDAEDDAIATP
jgi:hypothetical protein